MKAIYTTILILLSIISLLAQEERKFPRPLNEIEYTETSKNEFDQNIYETTSLLNLDDTININWQKLNGPYGGIITALYSSGDTIIVSAGMDKGIIFYSVNRGLTWEKSNFKNVSPISDLLITNYGSVLAAGGSAGLFESNNLIDWNRKNIKNVPSDLTLTKLGKDSNGGIYFTDFYRKELYYSPDSCRTGKLDYENRISVRNFLLADNGDLYAGDNYNIIVKRKDSTKWEKCLQIESISLGFHITKDSNGIIYAGSGNRSEFFESRDSGKTWIDKDTANFLHQLYYRDLTYNNGTLITVGWPDYMLSGWGVAISKDKGSTWEYSNDGLIPYSYAGKLTTSGEDTYLGIYGGGIYRSTNRGENWHPWMTGLAGATVNQLTFDEEGTLFAPVWNGGVQKSSDNGETWEIINNGLTISAIMSVCVDDSGFIYAGGGDQIKEATFRSTNKGESWEQVNDKFSFTLHKDKRNRIYAMVYGEGIYRSSDQGLTWQPLNTGLENYWAFGFAIDSLGNLYTGTRGGNLYKSTNDGQSWQVIRRCSITSSVIGEIKIDGDGTIYAINYDEGLLKSTDNGVTWELKTKGLEGRLKLSRMELSEDGEIILGHNGLFYSKDKGESFSDVTGNMELTEIRDFLYDENNNLYIATNESIFKGSLPLGIKDNKEEQVVTEYSLSQNYPNPFNPNTTINYALPEVGYVTLKIYNTLGEEVITLVNEYKQTGNHQVSFNAKDLSSGLYIYKLNAGGKTFSKKMMLLK